MLAAQSSLGWSVLLGIGGVMGSGALATGIGWLLQVAFGL